MRKIRLLQILLAAVGLVSLVFLVLALSGGAEAELRVLAAVFTVLGFLGSGFCALLRPVFQMKKIFVYTEEQERAMDRRWEYTQEASEKLSPVKQWQCGLPELRDLLRREEPGACPVCGAGLEWVRECAYVGLRHPVGATGGSYERTYEVKKKKYCPVCQRIV